MSATVSITMNPVLALMMSKTNATLNNNEIITPPTESEHINNNDTQKRHCNKKKGKDSEVFAFKTKEEISAMIDVFDNHIKNATNQEQLRIARRNKLLFLIGINIGIRGSDLCVLKWCDFLNSDGTIKETYRFQPKKTANKGKYVRLYYNKTVQAAITDYISYYPVDNLETYVFFSRKGNEAISRMSAGRIIKDAAAECGITRNINSHSFRKTWAYHIWHDSENKQEALVTLQYIFNHSSTATTMKYIGIMDDNAKNTFENLELGFDKI